MSSVSGVSDGSKMLRGLAEHYRENGACSKAEMIYKSLLTKEKQKEKKCSMLEKPNQSEIALLTTGLANVYTTAQDYEKALPILKKAIKLNQHVHGHDTHHLTAPFHNIGECHRQQGNFHTAEKWLKRSVSHGERKRLYPGAKDFQGEKKTFLALADCYQKKGDLKGELAAKAQAKIKECDIRQAPINSGRHHHTTSTSMPSFGMMQKEVTRLHQSCQQVPIPTQRELLMTMQDHNQPRHKSPHTCNSIFSLSTQAVYVRTNTIDELTRKQKRVVRSQQKNKTQKAAKPRNPKPRVRKGQDAGLAVDVLVKDALRQGLDILIQQLTLHPQNGELAQAVANQVVLQAQAGGAQQRRLVAAGSIPILVEALQRHSIDPAVSSSLAMALHSCCIAVKTDPQLLAFAKMKAKNAEVELKRERLNIYAGDSMAEARVKELELFVAGAIPQPLVVSLNTRICLQTSSVNC